MSTRSKEPFIKVGERVRFIGSGRHRRGDWPEGKWLEYGVTGTVTEYHSEQPAVRVRDILFEALPPYAVVKWDLGGATDTVIDPEDQGKRWERIEGPRPQAMAQTAPIRGAERSVNQARELVDKFTGVELSEALFDVFDSLPREQGQKFLEQTVIATLWHGTRRRESIEGLTAKGFCSYTTEQAVDWLIETHRRLCEYTKPGPRVCKQLDKKRAMILYEVRDPRRGKFSVTGLEWAACGEDPSSLFSGWADRNPEFVWDYLWWRANPKLVDKILTEMFGKPLKVTLRLKVKVRQLLGPQDIHLGQRCFTPEEIIAIEPCPPKTAKQLEAEIDLLWQPLVMLKKGDDLLQYYKVPPSAL